MAPGQDDYIIVGHPVVILVFSKNDFILVSISLGKQFGDASNDIDMGSDHRAVQAILTIPSQQHKRKPMPASTRGWYPDGNGKTFRDALDQNLDEVRPQTLFEMELLIRDTASLHGPPTKENTKTQIFQCEYFQNLLIQRRGCRDANERRMLSKQIKSYVRKELRKKKSARI